MSLADRWKRATTAVSVSAGYHSDSSSGKDALGIDVDCQLLAEVIHGELIEPPLSIGLFGRQAWGRSFFLALLAQTVENRAADHAAPLSVVQLHFNALHNADTNPWIALVDAVYRGLSDWAAQAGDEAFAGLGGTAARLRAETNAKVDAARAAEAEAFADFERAQREHDKNLERLAANASWQRWQHVEEQLWTELDEELQRGIEREGARLGVQGLGTRPEDLHNILEQTTSIEGMAELVGASVNATPWLSTFTAVVVGVVGAAAVFGAAWLLYGAQPDPGAYLDVLGKGLGVTGTLLTALGVLTYVVLRNRARTALRRLRGYRKHLRAAMRAADQQHHLERATAEEKVVVSRGALARSREALHRARQDVITTERAHEAFLEPGILRRVIELYRDMLTTKADLGAAIVPRIREDIEQLSMWIDEHGSRGGTVAIDRIVVYIDDLDSCPPERVFRILQATNLLLSIRPFVVVMTLDPLWTCRALQPVYPRLLSDDDAERLEGVALKYLARLIQVPFWLRPPDERGVRELVDMFTASPWGDDEDLALADTSPEAPLEVSPPETERDEAPTLEPSTKPRPRAPAAGRLTAFHRGFVQSLAQRMRTTPRALKRFVNSCRLVLMQIDRQAVAEEPTYFAATATLLAVVTAIPAAAPTLFHLLSNPELQLDFLESSLEDTGLPTSECRISVELVAVFSDYASHDAMAWLRRARPLAARHSLNVPPDSWQ